MTIMIDFELEELDPNFEPGKNLTEDDLKNIKEKLLWKDAEQGTPPRPGLVPQSGDPRHPDRWVSSVKNISQPTQYKITRRGEGYSYKVTYIDPRTGKRQLAFTHDNLDFIKEWLESRNIDSSRVLIREYGSVQKGVTKMSEQNNLSAFLKWVQKAEMGDPEVIYDEEGRRKKLRQLLDEQGFPEDIDDPDDYRDDVVEDKAEPWAVNENSLNEELTPEQKKKIRGEGPLRPFSDS